METEHEVKASSSSEDWYMNKLLKSGPVKVLSSMDGRSSKIKAIDDLLTGTDSPKSAKSYQKGMRKKDKLTPKRSDCNEDKLTPKRANCNENKLTPKRTDCNEPESKSCLKHGQPKALFLDDDDDCLGTMTLKEMCLMMKKSKSGQKKAGKENKSDSVNSTPVKLEPRTVTKDISDIKSKTETVPGREMDNVELLSMEIDSRMSDDVIPQRIQSVEPEESRKVDKSGSVNSCRGSLSRKLETDNVGVPEKDSCESITMEIDFKENVDVVRQKTQLTKRCETDLVMDVDSSHNTEGAESVTKADDKLLVNINSKQTDPMTQESGDVKKNESEGLKFRVTECDTKSKKRKSETDCQVSDDDDDIPLSVWQLNKKRRRDKKLRKESENISSGSLNAELSVAGVESVSAVHNVVKPEVSNIKKACPSTEDTDGKASILASVHNDVKLTPAYHEADVTMREVGCNGDAGLTMKTSQTNGNAVEVLEEFEPKEQSNVPSATEAERIPQEDMPDVNQNNQIQVSNPVLTERSDCGMKLEDLKELSGTGKLHLHLPDDSSDVEFVQSIEPTPTLDSYPSEKDIIEEDPESDHSKLSKIPQNRKSFSPLSREKLLQASKLGLGEQDLPDNRGLKRVPRPYKSYQSRDICNQDNGGNPISWPKANISHRLSSPQKMGRPKEETLPGSPLHNQEKSFTLKSPLSKMYGTSPTSGNMTSPMRQSHLFNNSPSQSPQQMVSPVKGILRSSSMSCQGPCKCEECTSIRSRAEKAAEFSQRQMQDIEGLAVKLLKELSTMRGVLEENMVHSMARFESPHSSSKLHKSKTAVSNALEAEKMAKSWLVRMARDCNRYCKIMRMQERKLTFADESGGQLCHVKLLHSQVAKEKSDPLVADKPQKFPPVQSS